MYFVLETLIIRPRSFATDAVLVSWTYYPSIVDSNRAMRLRSPGHSIPLLDIVLSGEGVFQLQSKDLMWPSS